jgi:hypothetical protein
VTPPGPVVPASAAATVAVERAALCGFRTALDDHQVAAFDLGHDAGEGLVYERVERGVADEVVCDVDLETFVLGDGRGDAVEDVGEGWDGAFGEVTAYIVTLACRGVMLSSSIM